MLFISQTKALRHRNLPSLKILFHLQLVIFLGVPQLLRQPFSLSFVEIHRKARQKPPREGQNAKKSIFLLPNGAKRAIL